jgi:DNA-binding FrmR family transcriptional regulator
LTVHKKSDEIAARLAKAEGHVRGIIKMVKEDRDCPAILLQIAAVQAALRKVSQIVLEDHIETCIAKAISEGRGETAIQDLSKALANL